MNGMSGYTTGITASNTLISPNFLVWKLGQITVFYALYDMIQNSKKIFKGYNVHGIFVLGRV